MKKPVKESILLLSLLYLMSAVTGGSFGLAAGMMLIASYHWDHPIDPDVIAPILLVSILIGGIIGGLIAAWVDKRYLTPWR